MIFFVFKQKTAYEMRISDWSSDVCSSDLETIDRLARGSLAKEPRPASLGGSPDLLRSACRTRILPMAMDRPGTGAARTAADDAQAQRGLTMEFRSEERRVGKGWVGTWRYRGWM